MKNRLLIHQEYKLAIAIPTLLDMTKARNRKCQFKIGTLQQGIRYPDML
jgi:hypothetical protein